MVKRKNKIGGEEMIDAGKEVAAAGASPSAARDEPSPVGEGGRRSLTDEACGADDAEKEAAAAGALLSEVCDEPSPVGEGGRRSLTDEACDAEKEVGAEKASPSEARDKPSPVGEGGRRSLTDEACGAEKEVGAAGAFPSAARDEPSPVGEGGRRSLTDEVCDPDEIPAVSDAVIDDLTLYAKEFSSVAAAQLYLQLQRGDLRAIKLYYDLEERIKREQEEQKASEGALHLARIGAIRRAVFGDDAMSEDSGKAAEYLAECDV